MYRTHYTDNSIGLWVGPILKVRLRILSFHSDDIKFKNSSLSISIFISWMPGAFLFNYCLLYFSQGNSFGLRWYIVHVFLMCKFLQIFFPFIWFNDVVLGVIIYRFPSYVLLSSIFSFVLRTRRAPFRLRISPSDPFFFVDPVSNHLILITYYSIGYVLQVQFPFFIS